MSRAPVGHCARKYLQNKLGLDISQHHPSPHVNSHIPFPDNHAYPIHTNPVTHVSNRERARGRAARRRRPRPPPVGPEAGHAPPASSHATRLRPSSPVAQHAPDATTVSVYLAVDDAVHPAIASSAVTCYHHLERAITSCHRLLPSPLAIERSAAPLARIQSAPACVRLIQLVRLGYGS